MVIRRILIFGMKLTDLVEWNGGKKGKRVNIDVFIVCPFNPSMHPRRSGLDLVRDVPAPETEAWNDAGTSQRKRMALFPPS